MTGVGEACADYWHGKVGRSPVLSWHSTSGLSPLPSLECAARSGLVEIGLGTFLLRRYQDSGSVGSRHPHGIVTVWARRQGAATAMGEIEAVKLFGKLGDNMVMVLAAGQGCH